MLWRNKRDDLRGVEERIEVRSTRETLVIDDFCSARSRSGRKRSKKTKLGRDKGQNAMFARFAECARDRESRPLYPDDALFWTSYMTYHAARMLRRGESSHQVGETGPRFTWPATVH